MKQISTLIFIFLIGLSTYAQRAEEREEKEIKLAVKWSPLHLFAYYPTIQLAVEHSLARKYSIQYEAGPTVNIGARNHLGGNDNSHFRGFKTNIEIRRHFFPRPTRRYYLAQQVFFNHINYTQQEAFAVHPELDQDSKDFFQNMKYGMRYREAGGVLKAGVIKSIGKFCIDIHFGISVSYVDKYAFNKPQYKTYSDYYPGGYSADEIFHPFENDHVSLHPTLGFRLGYIIR